MNYKVLFIDWDGTLSHSRFWERWRDSPEDNDKYHRLQNALFKSKEGEALIIEWMLGVKSYSDVLKYASTITDIPYDELASELQYSAENMKLIDENTLDLIQQLRTKGVKVLIATDNMDTFRNWTVPALGLNEMFDGILASDALGALKSHVNSRSQSLFFHRFLSQHEVGTNESVLIDNSLHNKALEQCGIDFLHVNEAASATDHLKTIMSSIH